MDKIRLKDKTFELFIPENEICQAIQKMAICINNDIGDANPLFVSILNGAFMFTAELMRQLDAPYELTFAKYSSYRGISTTGTVNEVLPVLTEVKGRVVIILEDIVDTGITMRYVLEKMKSQGAKEVRLATLLYKPEAMQCNLIPDYVGLEIPSDFIVGYGLDYDEMGRAYKDIYKLSE